MTDPLALPLAFSPVYQVVVWGGRRMATWRQHLPDGPIGESWDLSTQARGVSTVLGGDLDGVGLDRLVRDRGADLIGSTWDGGDFPLLIKLIDANDRLSVQVHPDDRLARSLDVGVRGKTECWFCVGDGGEIYQGTVPGTTRQAFEAAMDDTKALESLLNRYETRDGDFFFLPARSVHALGRNTLIWEVQQSCDCTFRVHDWGRVGLDGKPRPLHRNESLATIDFSDRPWGPVPAVWETHPDGGSRRQLVSCPYFAVEERRADATRGGGEGVCSILIVVDGQGSLATAAGALPIQPMQTYLVPAVAGAWSVCADPGHGLRFLVAHPC